MSKKLIYFLISLALIAIVGLSIFKYINKPMDDLENSEPTSSFTVSQLLKMSETDTIGLSKLKSTLIAVEGNIKSLQSDSNATTLELGDSNSYSTIVCQIDSRHTHDFSNFKVGSSISLKGKMTDFTIDTDLGLGNSIQLNYCTLNNK